MEDFKIRLSDYPNADRPEGLVSTIIGTIIGGFSLLVGVMFVLGLVLSGLGLIH
jgi:hypothetical protein